jgi:hypothetical protein
MAKREKDQPTELVFDVERMSRAERTERFRAAIITNVDGASPEVRHFVEQASQRYLDTFVSD